MPDVLTTYLNQKVTTLSWVAVLADELALTHHGIQSSKHGGGFNWNRVCFQDKSWPDVAGPSAVSPTSSSDGPTSSLSESKYKLVCFYCRKPGRSLTVMHIRQNRLSLKFW